MLFSGDKLRLALSSDLNGNNFITGQNEAQKQGDNLDYFFLSSLFYISLNFKNFFTLFIVLDKMMRSIIF